MSETCRSSNFLYSFILTLQERPIFTTFFTHYSVKDLPNDSREVRIRKAISWVGRLRLSDFSPKKHAKLIFESQVPSWTASLCMVEEASLPPFVVPTAFEAASNMATTGLSDSIRSRLRSRSF